MIESLYKRLLNIVFVLESLVWIVIRSIARCAGQIQWYHAVGYVSLLIVVTAFVFALIRPNASADGSDKNSHSEEDDLCSRFCIYKNIEDRADGVYLVIGAFLLNAVLFYAFRGAVVLLGL